MRNYIFIQTISIIFLIASGTTIYANQNLPDIKSIISEKTGDKTIQVFNRENGYSPEWFITSESNTIHLKNPPSTMYEVVKIKVSDDAKFLAVMSAGEGHPEIGIFRLSDILADKPTEVIYGIDPYPGVVDLIKWQKNKLHVTSNLFITERVEKYGRTPDALSLFSVESFLLDMNSGDITPVSDKLKNPVDYYGKHLLENPDEYSPSTELWAFSELKNRKAIPYLEKALKMKQYSKDKKTINNILLQLKKLK